MGRRRRSRLVRWFALAIVILLIIGVSGTDWFATNDQGGGPDDGTPELPLQTEPEVELTLPPAHGRSAAQLTGLGDGGTEGPGTEAPPTDRFAIRDRLRGCLRSIEQGIETGRFTEAFEAVAEAAALDLDDAQRGSLKVYETRLADAVDARLEALSARVVAGQVVRGTEELRDWIAPDAAAALRAAARDLAVAQGWPSLSLGLRDTASSPPAPVPLPQRRRVRVAYDGEWVAARVLEETDGRVSLRLVERGLFPVVARSQVEPIDPTVGEALDQAACAIRARDPLLAVLWLGFAKRRAKDLPERWHTLRGFLD